MPISLSPKEAPAAVEPRGGGLVPIKSIVTQVVEGVARRAIGRWLDKAAEAQNGEAADAFRQADAIRRKMGLDWVELIDARKAA